MKNLKSRIGCLALISVVLATSTVNAQNGPPPHVRTLVDSVLTMLRSNGDEPIGEFIDQSMINLEADERAQTAAELKTIRDGFTGLGGDIGVEATDNGVILNIGSGSVTRSLELVFEGQRIAHIGQPAASDPVASEENAVREHVRALETTGRMSSADRLTRFEEDHFSDSFLNTSNSTGRAALLDQIADVAARAGGAMIDAINDDYILTLRGPEGAHRIQFQVENASPWKMTGLTLTAVDPAIVLDRNNVASTVDALASDGLSGVVYVKIDGDVLLDKAYGMANPDLGIANRTDTIFGIGSRPIDFTIAGIFLLAQEGKLSLDDSIVEFFDNVPADKRTMTIRHLLNGESGLPDFHGRVDDWDQDLAWIDRRTAEERILGQTLLFAPGTDNAHSHSAFGLLAAIIERVSGVEYYPFLRRHFLDPAGMDRTGENGEARGLSINDFAVGLGPNQVGIPNIPPNHGPTSWLVKGSGGMYSSIEDLLKFYAFVQDEQFFEDRFRRFFVGGSVNLDGSDRGYELFSARTNDSQNHVFLIVNTGNGGQFGELRTALERLALAD